MPPRKRRIILSLIGTVLGCFIAGTYVDRYGGDIGFLFLPLGFLFSIGLIILLNSIAEILFGSPKAKKVAVVLLIVLATIVAWAVFANHRAGQTHYCSGMPVSQYPGPLPTICKY